MTIPAKTLSAVALLTLVSLGCNGDGPSDPNGDPAPVPVLQVIAPTSGVVGGAEFVLTATGSAFQENSSVLWNESVLPTTYVSATTLTATVAAGLLATPGTVDVTVRTPAPGGGQSTALPFEVGNPAPVLQAIAPTTGVVGGPEFVLTATGSGFQQNSNVLWNGSALPTTYVSQTTLTATVATSLLTAAGTAEVA
ncbi:MAG: hypothetical protein AMS20_11500, partial [Gemmatimonas sp. SG8_28]